MYVHPQRYFYSLRAAVAGMGGSYAVTFLIPSLFNTQSPSLAPLYPGANLLDNRNSFAYAQGYLKSYILICGNGWHIFVLDRCLDFFVVV